MAFTEDELEYLRGVLGTDMDDIDLEERAARTGNVPAAAAAVLRERLADLRLEPTQFALSGVYSQSNAGLLEALQLAIASADADAATLAEIGGGGITVGRMLRADGR